MKQLEGMGIPKSIFIEGVIFKIPGLDLDNFLKTGIATSRLNTKGFNNSGRIYDDTYSIHPREYIFPAFKMRIGFKSSIGITLIDGSGELDIGKFTQISWSGEMELDLCSAHKYRQSGHNYKSVAIYDPAHHIWPNPKPPIPENERKPCRIEIGNDVWIGRGCRFKVSDPDRPLVIGDGAVIASDSVVVKSIPPYTIWGGNPARFIKNRFAPRVSEKLQRIRWWDWDIEKIHDNYKYFDEPEQFAEMFDIQ